METTDGILETLLSHYPELEPSLNSIKNAISILYETVSSGGTILTCGNGGSYSDSQHIVGELVKKFVTARNLSQDEADEISRHLPQELSGPLLQLEHGIPSHALGANPALVSAISNDTDPNLIFAQELYVLGKKGDTLIGLSSSGNSKNVLNAALTARLIGAKVILLTGREGGSINEHADQVIHVPADETYRIQEYHLPIYHAICRCLEILQFGGSNV